MAQDLAQGDGKIGITGISDGNALRVRQRRVQVNFACLLELHHAYGGDHFGQGGDFVYRVTVYGPSAELAVSAVIVFIEGFPVPVYDHGPANGLRPGK